MKLSNNKIGIATIFALVAVIILGLGVSAYLDDGTYLAIAIGVAVIVLMAG